MRSAVLSPSSQAVADHSAAQSSSSVGADTRANIEARALYRFMRAQERDPKSELSRVRTHLAALEILGYDNRVIALGRDKSTQLILTSEGPKVSGCSLLNEVARALRNDPASKTTQYAGISSARLKASGVTITELQQKLEDILSGSKVYTAAELAGLRAEQMSMHDALRAGLRNPEVQSLMRRLEASPADGVVRIGGKSCCVRRELEHTDLEVVLTRKGLKLLATTSSFGLIDAITQHKLRPEHFKGPLFQSADSWGQQLAVAAKAHLALIHQVSASGWLRSVSGSLSGRANETYVRTLPDSQISMTLSHSVGPTHSEYGILFSIPGLPQYKSVGPAGSLEAHYFKAVSRP